MKTYRDQPSGTVRRARGLRRNATEAEKRMWHALRDKIPGTKFRRQVPIGPFYADFLCFSAKLVIEVDGGHHGEAQDYDARRTAFIEAQGYRIIRFWNNDVLENTDGVIAMVIDSLSPSPSQG